MITFQCGVCGKRLKTPHSQAGLRVRCHFCQSALTVPQAEADASSPAVPQHSETPPPPPDPQPSQPTIAGQSPGVSAEPPQPATSDSPPVVAPAGQFVIDTAAEGPAYQQYVRKRSSSGRRAWSSTGMWLVLGGLAIAIAGGVWWYPKPDRDVTRPTLDLVLEQIPEQTVPELELLDLTVRVANAKQWKGRLSFQLEESPEGARIDSQTGRLQWKPTEAHGPGEYRVTVRAEAVPPATADDTQTFRVVVTEQNQPPHLDPISDVSVNVGDQVRVQAVAGDDDVPPSKLSYELGAGCPSEAAIDSRTGLFVWTPDTSHAGRTFGMTVRVTETAGIGLSDSQSFRVTVVAAPTRSPLERLVASLEQIGLKVAPHARTGEFGFSGTHHTLHVEDEAVHVFAYETPTAARKDQTQVAADASTLFGKPRQWNERVHFYRDEELIALYAGSNSGVANALESVLGIPFATGKPSRPTTVTVETRQRDPGDEFLVGLYQEKVNRKKYQRLFSPREYKAIRKVFADRFQREHEAELRSTFGDQYDETMQWLDEHVDLKEELFTAFEPKYDDVTAGLTLFKTLKDRYPKRITRYASLAIATAVTWDKKRVNYDYGRHQRRCKAIMPSGLVAGVENFVYLVEAENHMEGRVQYVPWEFLTLLVNHKTPLPERQWALVNYVRQRVMFGKCYKDVPYDQEMLQTASQVARLNGHEYTLPNLRQYGGVCAMQADFAARVGKSMGVPAAYVSGSGRYGGRHAWVMWVELKAVTSTNISFTLESYGRYRGDHYYVGTLTDPHTGQRITDRDLERRLHAVGVDPFGRRQGHQIMQAYPRLRGELKMDRAEQLRFLSQVLGLSPWNEEAWVAVAQLAGGRELDKQSHKQMTEILSQLFTTFGRFPDFTWQVFDDLIAFETDLKKRIDYYYRLLDVYANAKRPDLSFKALLKLADYLVKDDRKNEAIQKLAVVIKQHADEGQYVPKMLDKLEELCRDVEGAEKQLVQFYSEFLPLIPKTRGGSPSQYCIKMFRRGIARFRVAGETRLAEVGEVELGKIQTGASKVAP